MRLYEAYSPNIVEGLSVLKNSRGMRWDLRCEAHRGCRPPRRGRCRKPQGLSLRQPPRSPAPEREQPLYVLARGDHQRLDVHPPEPPEPEAPYPVPLLGLPEERLNPHLALAQRLLVGLGLSVGANPFEELLLEAPPDHAPVTSRRAFGLRGASIAGLGLRPVLGDPFGVGVGVQAQGFSLRAPVEVSLGLVDEPARSVVGAFLLEICSREVGADGRLLHGCYVFLGAVGGIADDPAHPRPPAEARPPEQI